ncbi:hypothetical protein AAC387_Pa02g4770 [Persea americana]
MELPEFVTDLYNLLTLRLNKCTRLCMLPIGMSKMVKLRHLEIESTDLTFLPNGLGRLSSLRTLSKFPVGDENGGCKIEELKNLNLLRGKLKLQNLERVMNGNEAMEAELDKKSGLHGLSLECESRRDEVSEILGDDVEERMESVFEGLRSPGRDQQWGMVGDDEIERMKSVFEGLRPPHSDLRKLKILNYVGSKFPTWLEDSKFPSLVKVVLKDCCKCRVLPGLGKLHSLKYLEICGADEVKVVGGEFYGKGDDRVKGRVFPRLKNLFFDAMSNWEEWKLTKEYGEVMPSLSLLSISNCHKLKALPNCLPNSLRKVVIDNCDRVIWVPDKPLPLLEDLSLVGDLSGILSMPLPFLPALKTLEIKETSNSLSDYGWEVLESLHTISIYDCPRLELPDDLGKLKALQTLNIYKCSQLTFLPFELGQLESLHTIWINECNGLMSLLHGPGQFKALRNLEISYCTELWSLSDELVRPEALETIDIYYCSELTSLFGGFEQLTSLRSLKICYCPELRHLPKLQHLISLEELKIMECPLVTELLEKGEDCYNMSHIPCIEIDGRKI